MGERGTKEEENSVPVGLGTTSEFLQCFLEPTQETVFHLPSPRPQSCIRAYVKTASVMIFSDGSSEFVTPGGSYHHQVVITGCQDVLVEHCIYVRPQDVITGTGDSGAEVE